MKNLKIVLASLLLVAGGISVSSFVAKGYNKSAFVQTCYYFNAPTHTGTPTLFKDVVGTDRNLIQTEVQNTANWISVGSVIEPPADCNNGEFGCAICFDQTVSGGAGFTLQEAINQVWSYYTTNAGLPNAANVSSVSGKTINFFRQSTLANH